MTEEMLAARLTGYLPKGTENIISRWIIEYKVFFRVTKPRSSVYGDYTSPIGAQGHKISVNGNQNKFSFLITTIHEFAHLTAWQKYRNRVKPHGEEWKSEFRQLLTPFIKMNVFPDNLHEAITSYIADPSASSCSDEKLMKALRSFDRNALPFLEDLPEGSLFELNAKIFIKGKKQRTRFQCREKESGSMYFVSGIAEIKPVEEKV
jgi:SprT protein